MNDLNKRLEDKEIKIRLSEEAKEYIVENAYDPSFGARPLKRYLQKHVETLVAKLILADEVSQNGEILITLDENKNLIGIHIEK